MLAEIGNSAFGHLEASPSIAIPEGAVNIGPDFPFSRAVLMEEEAPNVSLSVSGVDGLIGSLQVAH